MNRKEETEEVLHSNTLIITMAKGKENGIEVKLQECSFSSNVQTNGRHNYHSSFICLFYGLNLIII